MSITIYHNPRCSKSRKTLQLLREAGVETTVVEYLETPPDGGTILHLAALLRMPVADLVRTGEDDYRHATDLPEPTDDAALADWIAAHPRVLQRPIVVAATADRAVIGRPPENVLELVRR
jgi:arsenate reductase (glutaredoxin)